MVMPFVHVGHIEHLISDVRMFFVVLIESALWPIVLFCRAVCIIRPPVSLLTRVYRAYACCCFVLQCTLVHLSRHLAMQSGCRVGAIVFVYQFLTCLDVRFAPTCINHCHVVFISI